MLINKYMQLSLLLSLCSNWVRGRGRGGQLKCVNDVSSSHGMINRSHSLWRTVEYSVSRYATQSEPTVVMVIETKLQFKNTHAVPEAFMIFPFFDAMYTTNLSHHCCHSKDGSCALGPAAF